MNQECLRFKKKVFLADQENSGDLAEVAEVDENSGKR
jgi:hypothetical protein